MKAFGNRFSTEKQVWLKKSLGHVGMSTRLTSERVTYNDRLRSGTKNQPAPPGSPGGSGKRNSPDSRAQTFKILAPDWGPRGWGNIGVIIT